MGGSAVVGKHAAQGAVLYSASIRDREQRLYVCACDRPLSLGRRAPTSECPANHGWCPCTNHSKFVKRISWLWEEGLYLFFLTLLIL